MTDFQKKAINDEEQKLKYYTIEANQENDLNRNRTMFLNLTVLEVLQKISQTVIDILNEIVNSSVLTFKDLFLILTKDDRIIYLGLILVLLSIFVYLIDISH